MKYAIVVIVAVLLFSASSSRGLVSSFLVQQIERPQLVLQTGHALGVNAIAFAPDHSWLASAAADNTVILWQTSSGRQLRALTSHRGYVRTVAVSHDGHLLASGGNDLTVKIWDVNSAREVFSLTAHSGPIVSLAFSPDNLLLASGSIDKTIRIWDLKTGREIQTLTKHTAPVTGLAFGNTGGLLISAANGELLLWNTKSWQSKQLPQQDVISALAVSDDETSIAAGTVTGQVSLWATGSDRARLTLKNDATPVLALGFGADKSLMAIHSSRGIDIWDSHKGNLRSSVSGDNNLERLASATIALDNSLFASTIGNRILSTNSTVTGEVDRNFESHATPINAIAFSGDDRWFASAANDGSIRLWQVATGRELPRLTGHAGYVTTVAFSPNGELLASGSTSGEVKIWHTDSSQKAIGLPSHTKGVNSLGFDSTGRLLAVVGQDKNVEVWDLEQKQARILAGHSHEITSVVFARNSLITAGRDKTIRVWDARSGRTIKSVQSDKEINSLALNATEDLLASANADGTVTCWNIATGVAIRTLVGHTNEALSVKFSPNGSFLISTSADHTAILWNLQTGTKVQRLSANSDTVTSVAFSKDGAWILTGSNDGSILLWEARSGRLAATLIAVADSDDWLVATPDGLFDGSPDSWDLMLWRFEQRTFNVVPVEAYFNEYYYPGLLAEIMAGENPQPVEDLARKDRRQPSVLLKATSSESARSISIEIVVNAIPPDGGHSTDSGARDLRLFRNGLLVKTWTGDLLKQEKSSTIQTTVPIVAGANKFTAYAFNNDNIKSSNASLLIQGPESLRRRGTAYLLMIGVEQYQNPEYNLRYSASDVSEMEAQLKAQQERLGNYDPIITIPLLNRDATKANILLALNRLAGTGVTLPPQAPSVLTRIKSAQPEDAVLIYFSGHGLSANNHFYLIPYDLGYNGQRNKLDTVGLATIVQHGIADNEIETALQPLDANQLLLLIDACYSGQAIESTERRRGPMNTKGLAQLAYEKGIYVLTASQSIEVAFEAEAFKHSYLAYALLEEGLKAGAADINHDGNIFLREWFDYANTRVPQLRKMKIKGKELVEDEPDEQKVQRPRVFYTREEGAKTFLIAKTPTN